MHTLLRQWLGQGCMQPSSTHHIPHFCSHQSHAQSLIAKGAQKLCEVSVCCVFAYPYFWQSCGCLFLCLDVLSISCIMVNLSGFFSVANREKEPAQGEEADDVSSILSELQLDLGQGLCLDCGHSQCSATKHCASPFPINTFRTWKVVAYNAQPCFQGKKTTFQNPKKKRKELFKEIQHALTWLYRMFPVGKGKMKYI